MRKYETKTKTIEQVVISEIFCDLCGVKAEGGDWESSCYETKDSKVSMTVYQKDGESFPDGGSGTEFCVDICPCCFAGVLVPFLRSEGAKIEEKEWDF